MFLLRIYLLLCASAATALAPPTPTHFRLARGSLIPPPLLPPLATNATPNNPMSLLDLDSIEHFAESHGLKEAHVSTLYNAFLRRGSAGCGLSEPRSDLPSLSELTDKSFPKSAASSLLSSFSALSTSVSKVVPSSSGGYRLLILLPTGQSIETVIIKHMHTNGKTRYTVCLSSQVGCARACSFCATGTIGLKENLPASSILEQFLHAQLLLASKDIPASSLTNVVFMGQGEPLDNYGEVLKSLRGLTHQCLFNLSPSRITVSTVAPVPSIIKRLADDAPAVNLAVSLHGATQELRELTVPSARGTSIEELGAALDYHAKKSGRGAMLEYLLIDGVNDGDLAAESLASFARARGSQLKPFVNLIPYNPTLAGAAFSYKTPTDERINSFHALLKNEKIQSSVRWSSAAGRDAGAACGQLVLGE
ncbi:hypothetical protein TrVE_jg13727 [Triparma verrucosa]|uniref:Radical SAM core domain-containing protein n=1 Tax=Triparma verrucosa TaxID=1606542 RepID=A0A9W7CCR6_9STRA|nr:hypothetical protein TrVE_jg13727 [Triparma verrucosa]